MKRTPKTELWLNMLTTYVSKMKYENGITIPNLIGAYYEYDNKINLKTSDCVKLVLQEIIDSLATKCVLIQECPEIRQYVISIYKCEIENNNNIQGRIFFNLYDKRISANGCDIDSVATYLYEIYCQPIQNKLFSYSAAQSSWNKFSEHETKLIHELFVF